MRKLVYLLLATGALGCSPEPEFKGVTVPPLTKTAELDGNARKIAVSKGVALAFECTYQGMPCDGASVKVGDAGVAIAFESYVDQLKDYACDPQEIGACAKVGTVFVVVGVSTGKTHLDVSTDHGPAEFSLEVLP